MSGLAAVLGAATAAIVACIGRATQARAGRHGGSVPSGEPTAAGWTERIGRVAWRVGRLGPADSDDERRAGRTCLAAVAGLPVLPPLAVAILGAGWIRVRVGRIRAARQVRRAVADGLPEAVDLFLLCCGAGVALPLAHPMVAGHLGPPIGPALAAAHQATEAGAARADALTSELGRLGDRAISLAQVLADHLRYGVALAPSLDRLGLELRLDRRRRAEQDARRVPIRLLGPLITCVLPAFGLLTVVPLLVASLQALPT
jgi:tight adherence protein C